MSELKHHGVKGMRWGIRRSREELGGRTKKQFIKDHKKATKQIKKGKTVGENTRDTITKYKKEVQEATKDQRAIIDARRKMNIKARNEYLRTPTSFNPLNFKAQKREKQAMKDWENSTKEYKRATKQYMNTANKIAKKYRVELSNSLMKDLSVSDLHEGRWIANEPFLTSRKISDVFAGYGYGYDDED